MSIYFSDYIQIVLNFLYVSQAANKLKQFLFGALSVTIMLKMKRF
jgi:hypothetical protein